MKYEFISDSPNDFWTSSILQRLLCTRNDLSQVLSFEYQMANRDGMRGQALRQLQCKSLPVRFVCP